MKGQHMKTYLAQVKVGEASTHHGPRLVEQLGPGLAGIGGGIEFGYDTNGTFDVLLVRLPDDQNPDILATMLPGISFSEVHGVDVPAVPDQDISDAPITKSRRGVLAGEARSRGGAK